MTVPFYSNFCFATSFSSKLSGLTLRVEPLASERFGEGLEPKIEPRAECSVSFCKPSPFYNLALICPTLENEIPHFEQIHHPFFISDP